MWDKRQFQSGAFYIFLKEFPLQCGNLAEMGSTISNTLQLGHHFPHGLCKKKKKKKKIVALTFGGRVTVVFVLTLRKVSRDPFSMNSVMIITGLPV